LNIGWVQCNMREILSGKHVEEFKSALEKWLQTKHPSYIKDMGDREWSNAFSGRHHTAVIIIDQFS